MTDNKEIQHFEELWNTVEPIATKVYKDADTAKISNEIGKLMSSYQKAEAIEQADIKKSLKQRYIGEMLFLLCFLSGRDDINVFRSLLEQKIINELL